MTFLAIMLGIMGFGLLGLAAGQLWALVRPKGCDIYGCAHNIGRAQPPDPRRIPPR